MAKIISGHNVAMPDDPIRSYMLKRTYLFTFILFIIVTSYLIHTSTSLGILPSPSKFPTAGYRDIAASRFAPPRRTMLLADTPVVNLPVTVSPFPIDNGPKPWFYVLRMMVFSCCQQCLKGSVKPESRGPSSSQCPNAAPRPGQQGKRTRGSDIGGEGRGTATPSLSRLTAGKVTHIHPDRQTHSHGHGQRAVRCGMCAVHTGGAGRRVGGLRRQNTCGVVW